MKSLLEIFVVFTVLSYMSLNVEAIMCYNCSNCGTDSAFSSSISSAIKLNCSGSCSVSFYKIKYYNN